MSTDPDHFDVTLIEVGLALMEAGYSHRYAQGPMIRLAVQTAIDSYRDAGLLIRSGSVRREEWCVTYLGPLGRDLWSGPFDERAEAGKALATACDEGTWREPRLERRALRSWQDGAVWIGAWIEVSNVD